MEKPLYWQCEGCDRFLPVDKPSIRISITPNPESGIGGISHDFCKDCARGIARHIHIVVTTRAAEEATPRGKS